MHFYETKILVQTMRSYGTVGCFDAVSRWEGWDI